MCAQHCAGFGGGMYGKRRVTVGHLLGYSENASAYRHALANILEPLTEVEFATPPLFKVSMIDVAAKNAEK